MTLSNLIYKRISTAQVEIVPLHIRWLLKMGFGNHYFSRTGGTGMTKEEAVEKGLRLADRSGIAMLGTQGADGYPCIKAMIKVENEGIKKIWFSTNTSSRRVSELALNSRACVYFVDMEKWMGLMLTGTVEILQDPDSRKRIWREGYEKYYKLGVDDPDYTVLCFTAIKGNYYHNLEKMSFEL